MLPENKTTPTLPFFENKKAWLKTQMRLRQAIKQALTFPYHRVSLQ